MSRALFDNGGLQFWNEQEIELREAFQRLVVSVVKCTLMDLNPAWVFARVEGPCLHPRNQIGSAYDDSDVFVTNHKDFCLRAETTPSSYAYARSIVRKPPLCVYQSGKSFRRETSDGATAAKLRFNEFYQLEFQCIYSDTTKADYRAALLPNVALEVKRFTGRVVRLVNSDRLPAYSESTIDIEADHDGHWREVASCSIRTDYAPDMRVCEVAIGLDRVVALSRK